MKYVSLDIETTCLRPAPEHILMLSMVIADTLDLDSPVEALPHFTCFVDQSPISGDAYALGLNHWILDYLCGRAADPPYPIYGIGTMAMGASAFLDSQFLDGERITCAGKNVAGFDLPFLPKSVKDRFRHRTLDPGSLFFRQTDSWIPDLGECKVRAGINTPVAHDAREDALDVIRLIRFHMRNKK